jgi:hypothetical protein
MISDIKVPDSSIARHAEEFVRSVSSEMLFNHVMRSYWFAELWAHQEGAKVDSELMFLSAALHDLGLTDLGRGSHRFEIEGANASRTFLLSHEVSSDRAWKVWDNIALHPWDVNLFRDDTSRLMQLGILYDVRGVEAAKLDRADVDEVVRRYPRLEFKRGFYDLLCKEVDSKQPYEHSYHLCTCVAHNRSSIALPDARAVLNHAPFEE